MRVSCGALPSKNSTHQYATTILYIPRTDIFGLHINGEGHYGFCTPQCGPNSIPLTGVNARETNSDEDTKDAVVFVDELPVILDYPK